MGRATGWSCLERRLQWPSTGGPLGAPTRIFPGAVAHPKARGRPHPLCGSLLPSRPELAPESGVGGAARGRDADGRKQALGTARCRWRGGESGGDANGTKTCPCAAPVKGLSGMAADSELSLQTMQFHSPGGGPTILADLRGSTNSDLLLKRTFC